MARPSHTPPSSSSTVRSFALALSLLLLPGPAAAALPTATVDGLNVFIFENGRNCMSGLVDGTFVPTTTLGACGAVTAAGFGLKPTSIVVGLGGKVTWSVYASTTCSGTPLTTTVTTTYNGCNSVILDGTTSASVYVIPFLRLPSGVPHNISTSFYTGSGCSTYLADGSFIGNDRTCTTVDMNGPVTIKTSVNPSTALVTWSAFAGTQCSGTTILSGSAKTMGPCHDVTDVQNNAYSYQMQLDDDFLDLQFKPANVKLDFYDSPSSCSSSGSVIRSITIPGSTCFTGRLPGATRDSGFTAKYDILNGLVDWYAYSQTNCFPMSSFLMEGRSVPGTCLQTTDTSTTPFVGYYYKITVTAFSAPVATATATATATRTATATSTKSAGSSVAPSTTSTATATATGTATATSTRTATPSPTATSSRTPTASPSMLPAPSAPVLDAFSVTFYADSKCSQASTVGYLYAKSGQCATGSLQDSPFALLATATAGIISWSSYAGSTCTGTPALSSTSTRFLSCQAVPTGPSSFIYIGVVPELRFPAGRAHNVSVTFFSSLTCASDSAINTDPITVVGDGASCSALTVPALNSKVAVRATYTSGKVAWSAFANAAGTCTGTAVQQSATGAPSALGECITVSTVQSGGVDVAFRLGLDDLAIDLLYPAANLVVDLFSTSTCGAGTLTDSVTLSSVTDVNNIPCKTVTLSTFGVTSMFGAFSALTGTVSVYAWEGNGCPIGSETTPLAFTFDEAPLNQCLQLSLGPGSTVNYRIRAATPPSASPSPAPPGPASSSAASATSTPTPTPTPSVTPQSLAKAKLTLAGVTLGDALAAGASFINPIREAVAAILNVAVSAVRVTGLRSAAPASRLLLGAGAIRHTQRSLADTTGVIADLEVRAPPATAANFQSLVTDAATNPSSANAAVLAQMVTSISAATSSSVTLNTTALAQDFAVLTPAQQAVAASASASASASAAALARTEDASSSSSSSSTTGAAVGGIFAGLIVGGIAAWVIATKRAASATEAAVAAAVSKAEADRRASTPYIVVPSTQNPMVASMAVGRGRVANLPPVPVKSNGY